jgi:outer membrane protein OmpA-like peptidoglycan-associated protein
VLGYINLFQINIKIGDPADPVYLVMLPAAAVVNEAIRACNTERVPAANVLHRKTAMLARPGDLLLLNSLSLTSWQLGQRDDARDAFGKLVASGPDLERVPIKFLFQPGGASFNAVGDLLQQYQIWVGVLAKEIGKARSCVRIVGHNGRTGIANVNERLLRQRAETMQRIPGRSNQALVTRLNASCIGSREAPVRLGTDSQRDALDRRVEFRVVDCV